ncbi:Uncharacterized conserved protein [Serratia fonticola]|uniref:Uncharacterized conserved protein n=1 Tax=Serratia fonticola TaxID=47917 RepID=A0A4U9TB55_SERFO|nr:Uncharacterized conserved protein [Serratia fonticola]
MSYPQFRIVCYPSHHGENLMNIDDELQALATQEADLTFHHFDHTTAWELGVALKNAAEHRQLPIAIEIQLNGQTLFYYALPGATPDIADWVRRKRNVVNHFHKSSYAVGLRLQQRQVTLEERYGLSVRDYAAHGWRIPHQPAQCGLCRFHLSFWLPAARRPSSAGQHSCSVSRLTLARSTLSDKSCAFPPLHSGRSAQAGAWRE